MTTQQTVERLLPIEWAEYFDGDCDASDVRYGYELLESWLYMNPHLSYVNSRGEAGTSNHDVPELAGEFLVCYTFTFIDTKSKRHPLASQKAVIVGNKAKLPLPKVPA
jgi:hypothetical protein